MKKNIFVSIILSLAVLVSCFSMPVYAAGENNVASTSIEYFDDGSYMVITITEEASNSRASTKTASKKASYKNSDGDVLWTYTITGTFTYTGSSSTCTAVSDSYTIYNDRWHMDSHSTWKSGNTAYGTVTMKRKVLGITIKTVSHDLQLTCSATGVLS